MSIKEPVTQWSKQNIHKMVGAFMTKGGWEGWTQVELALYLTEQFKNQPDYNIEREVRKIFNSNSQMADFVFSFKSSTTTTYRYIVEIKCEPIFAEASTGDYLVAETKKDIQKLNNIKDAYKGSTVVMLSYAISPETIQYAQKEFNLQEIPFEAIPLGSVADFQPVLFYGEIVLIS